MFSSCLSRLQISGVDIQGSSAAGHQLPMVEQDVVEEIVELNFASVDTSGAY